MKFLRTKNIVFSLLLISFIKQNVHQLQNFKTNKTIFSNIDYGDNSECPRDLLFFKSHFQNFTLYEAQNANIPKTVHFFVKSYCITFEIYKNLEAWIESKHSIELHSLEDIKKHIFNAHQKFSFATHAWECAITHEARLDIARFIFLYDFGGLSADINTIPTNLTFAKIYHQPSHKYISDGISRKSNISLPPRIVASTKNNIILYANFLSSTAMQYRQHVFNKTNFPSYEDSRWYVYGSWQWKDRYQNYGIVVMENLTDANNILNTVDFSEQSKEISSLEEKVDSCVSFENLPEDHASEEIFSFINEKSESFKCDHNKLFNVDNVILENSFSSQGKIPKIIHMTAKNKCVTAHVKSYVDEWKNIPKYSFIFHDDDSVERLFQQYEWPEFPLLKQITKCISNGAMKADLWRYLLLWKFGGVYTDLDNGIGYQFNNASFIADDMDALFEVERGGFPSQYFFAVSPRHPIMYFALSIAIENIMNHAIYKTRRTMFITGPAATKIAMIAHADTKNGYLTAGAYTGKSMRNVTFIGSKYHAQHKIYIRRDAAKDTKEGHLMKMDHYIGNAKNLTKHLPKHSCRRELVSNFLEVQSYH